MKLFMKIFTVIVIWNFFFVMEFITLHVLLGYGPSFVAGCILGAASQALSAATTPSVMRWIDRRKALRDQPTARAIRGV